MSSLATIERALTYDSTLSDGFRIHLSRLIAPPSAVNEMIANRMPFQLQDQEWVRFLAIYAHSSMSLWELERSKYLADYYRAICPGEMFAPEVGIVDSWQKLDDELGMEIAEWLDDNRWTLVHDLRLGWTWQEARFVQLVVMMFVGWRFPNRHHLESIFLQECEWCSEVTDGWSRASDTSRIACDNCAGNHWFWSDYAEEWFEYQNNCPENNWEEEADEIGHELVGYNKYTEARFGECEFGSFYGFELEIERAEARESFAELLDRLPDNGLYCAHDDGSLQQGIEIVSEPMSGDYIRDELDLSWLAKARRAGWRSWDRSTCGLHIHTSRAGFANDVHLFAFASLFYSNQSQMTALAGRTSEYGSFDYTKRAPLALDVKKKANFTQRYVAVNLTNEHTAEVRIFKGSLNERRVRSALELVSGAVEFTRPLTIRDLASGALEWTRFVEFLRARPTYYKNTLELINEKGL